MTRTLLPAALLGALLAAAAASAQTTGDVALGKKVYTANCMACHGDKGDGKGPAAVALTPKPTNFQDPAFWQGKDDAALKASIKAGRPGTSMAPFPQLGEADLANLIVYLRTFEKKPAAPAQP